MMPDLPYPNPNQGQREAELGFCAPPPEAWKLVNEVPSVRTAPIGGTRGPNRSVFDEIGLSLEPQRENKLQQYFRLFLGR